MVAGERNREETTGHGEEMVLKGDLEGQGDQR
jgi:hypothetical protein